ncbi:MAG: PGPGW domain-containing protein [Magnetovibrionaceae bacterium]
MKRYILIGIGWALVAIGLVVIPTPIPFGMALTALGLYILAWQSMGLRNKLRTVRARYPETSRWLRGTTDRLPRSMRSLLRRTDPHRIRDAFNRRKNKPNSPQSDE